MDCAPPIGTTEIRSASRFRPRRSARASSARWSLTLQRARPHAGRRLRPARLRRPQVEHPHRQLPLRRPPSEIGAFRPHLASSQLTRSVPGGRFEHHRTRADGSRHAVRADWNRSRVRFSPPPFWKAGSELPKALHPALHVAVSAGEFRNETPRFQGFREWAVQGSPLARSIRLPSRIVFAMSFDSSRYQVPFSTRSPDRAPAPCAP